MEGIGKGEHMGGVRKRSCHRRRQVLDGRHALQRRAVGHGDFVDERAKPIHDVVDHDPVLEPILG